MISMQLHCYFALWGHHELKNNGDTKGNIYKGGYLCIYLSFHKVIIWVDVLSLSSGVPVVLVFR